ncbi:MAG: response regulator [Spirochaetales bacterium]|nr:response regulator [Spirochaetales bacterium]
MTYIVIEESASVRHLLCYLLLSLGIKGLPHESKDSALEDIANRPEIEGAIVDIDNKSVQGLDFIKAIKSRFGNRNIKLIAHTVQSHKDSVMAMAEMGVQGYLLKPFHETESFKKLKNIIQNFSGPNDNQRQHIRVVPLPDELLRVHFRVTGNPTLISGKIINISMGGLAIELVSPIEEEVVKPGILISKMQFSLFGRELTPSGELIVKKEKILGIRFESISPNDSIHLAKYIYDRVSQEQ